MNLIERYIFQRTLALSLITLFATTAMVLVTQVLLYVNLLTASGQALLTFLSLAATLIPPMTNFVLPFALYIGASQTLGGMNSDSELAVIEASGGSLWVESKPIVVLSLLMALLSLALSHFAEPWAQQSKREIIAKASADLVRFAVQSGTFEEIQPRLYLQIAEQLPSGDFGGIFIADMRNPEMDLIYYAKTGAIQPIAGTDALVLADGEVQRRTPKSGELSVVRFKSYVLDLGQFSAGVKGRVRSPKEYSTAFLMFGPATDEVFKRYEPEEVRSEIYRRFSDWIYPILYGAIAIYFSVGARSTRQERILSLISGFALALSIRGVGFFLVNVSGDKPLYAFLNFAVPIFATIVVSTLVVMNKSQRIMQVWDDWMSGLVAFAVRLWSGSRYRDALPSGDGSSRP